ncbi:phosphonate degradation HD-domain oxygenase [Gimesia panareensis]|uniref:phosphonate degradation HD-domain oxygenase n=1 Tax=Gimesia panareensis TaxID=2527978 RepID=UPI001189D22E|nr:phosphonate degradation HD-domain oxygenase [Gimesia panareensis]QDU47855.1 HD domain protein [Gimesia panareensis]
MSPQAETQDILQEIRTLFAEKGNDMYAGEAVSQTEHALQAASAAEQEEASQELITAALLHDIGHLLHKHDEDCATQGIDDLHERIGAAWLKKHFPEAVTEPIRLHVDAKRYRCATDAEYLSRLSPASVLSLELQGGPFDERGQQQFESNPWHLEALRLRNWDEAAKIPGLETPELEYFLTSVQRVLQQQPGDLN